MRALFKSCNAAYWLALSIWLAAIISAAVAATGVFSVLPKLGIHIDKYAAALGNDPAEHGRLAGGMIMEPIFAATDLTQVAAAAVVIVALLLQFVVFRMRAGSFANIVRILCIVVAAGLVGYHVFDVAPRMNQHLRAYWVAAEHNDRSGMQEHRTAFDADHIKSTRLYTGRLALLLVAVLSSAAAFTPEPAKRPAVQAPDLLRQD